MRDGDRHKEYCVHHNRCVELLRCMEHTLHESVCRIVNAIKEWPGGQRQCLLTRTAMKWEWIKSRKSMCTRWCLCSLTKLDLGWPEPCTHTVYDRMCGDVPV